MTQDLKQRIINAVESSPYRDYIQSISLFGSYLYGNQKPDSDLDLLVRLNKRIDYFTLIALQEDLQKRIGQNIDLLTPAELSHFFRNQVLKEAKVVYNAKAFSL
ncbi:MAG: nucleotidyltransferase family protein [Patescibacteria group bacterium]